MDSQGSIRVANIWVTADQINDALLWLTATEGEHSSFTYEMNSRNNPLGEWAESGYEGAPKDPSKPQIAEFLRQCLKSAQADRAAAMTDEGTAEQILLDDSDVLVRSVGRSLIEHGFGHGVSLFDPARTAWVPETVDELYRRYNEKPDMGTDTFLVKLERQLEGASDDAILLVAELLTLHALPLANFGQGSKQARISKVLGWMSTPVEIPPQVDDAFAQAAWNGGAGAHTMIWKWLQDAVVLTRSWWALPDAERATALGDPWSWEAVIRQFPGMPLLREELLYLGFPGFFLPIINRTHKRQIRDAFGYRLERRTGDLDRDLYLITVAVQRDYGGFVDYYAPPFVQDWRPIADQHDGDQQRAWLVRPRPGGRALVEQWKRDGFVSLAASHLDE
jgi:5-methylcytosine-specific restriction enzyme B